MNGLAEMAGSSFASNTGLPLKVTVILLMILRGMIWPFESLRRPDSIGCGTRVLISTTTPFLASLGMRIFGLLFAMGRFLFQMPVLRKPAPAAAAAAGDLYPAGRVPGPYTAYHPHGTAGLAPGPGPPHFSAGA